MWMCPTVSLAANGSTWDGEDKNYSDLRVEVRENTHLKTRLAEWRGDRTEMHQSECDTWSKSLEFCLNQQLLVFLGVSVFWLPTSALPRSCFALGVTYRNVSPSQPSGKRERERERWRGRGSFFFSILFRSEVVEHFCPALDVRIDS